MRLFPKDRDLNAPLDQLELVIDGSDFGERHAGFLVRLDVFLASRLKWRSRSSIQGLVKGGYVSVDAATPEFPRGSGDLRTEGRPGRRLAHGSRVVVRVPEGSPITTVQRASSEIAILYEDDEALVVDKPPLVTVHPSGRYLSDTLIQRVYAHYACNETGVDRELRPRLCHRLDRETSGLILIGKTPPAHAEFMRQFEAREVDKEYLALVRGAPERDGGTIDLPIGASHTSCIGLKMAVVPDGQPAVTEWEVRERWSDGALVACRPKTGRQHQIRVHMDAIGHPLVGDKLYGCADEVFQRHADGELTERDQAQLELPRQALHNHWLAFTSPSSGRRIDVRSPLAGDLVQYMREAQATDW